MASSIDWMRRAQGDILDAAGFGPSECLYRVVASGPYWRLRDYGHEGGTPLLVVAAPIKHPYLWDLTPAVSALRCCLDYGLHVRLLEWAAPEEGLRRWVSTIMHTTPSGHALLGLPHRMGEGSRR